MSSYPCLPYPNPQYDRLAELLRMQSQFYSKIIHSDRYYSNYYRVVYFGADFDEVWESRRLIRFIGLAPRHPMHFNSR